MGKTRMEELFYELYASSKRHDPWQRYAMVRELRDLMKQPKGSRSDHFERSGDDRRFGGVGQFRKGADDDEEQYLVRDEELAEIEADTKSSGIEYRAVENEANSKVIAAIVKEESIPQSKVSIPQPNSEILKSIEPGKVDLGLEKLEVGGDVERGQEVMSNAKICSAHQLFDHMPSKEKRMKHLKAWKFKFKSTSKRSRLMDDKFSFADATVLLNKDPQEIIWDCINKEFKDNVAGCGKTRVDRFKHHKGWKFKFKRKSLVGNHPRMLRQPHKSRVQCKMRMMNDSWSMRRPTLEIMKSHRKHKWKTKHLQIASNFWINHPPKRADWVLRTALTDWRTKNSKGLAYDGCVILEMNLAGFGRGKTELIATSQKMQKMDFFSFGIHTEMEENVELKQLLVAMEIVSQEVIEQKIDRGLICGDDSSKGGAESFPFLKFAAGQHLLWMQNNSEPIFILSELERKKKLCYKTWMFKYKVDDDDQGILQSAVICFLRRRHLHLHLDCEEPELAGRKISETSDQCNYLHQYAVLLLASVAYDAQFSVGVGTNKKQLRLSLRNNQVWDPGG